MEDMKMIHFYTGFTKWMGWGLLDTYQTSL